MSTRPPYIYQGGSVLMHSPLDLMNSDMYGFFVKGDLAKLQASVDSTLNTVAAGRMNFKVLSPYVMLTFTRVSHANSEVAVDKDKGWITEIDIITWIMVGAMDDKGKLSYIYWYPFHVFVDNAMALINGRELFGYPKYSCIYEIPEAGTPPLRCSVSAEGFQPFSPETEIAMHPLLEVNGKDHGGKDRPIKTWAELIEQAITLFLSIPDFFNMDAAGWEDIVSLLRNPRIDQIFLKQFPDSAGIKAVYQAILSAPAEINKIHGGSLLGYEYECTLHQFDSFPLAETLGLQLGAQQAILPFNVNFDFSVPPGVELVNNSVVNPEKIAILGGGVGAMTAAYFLTDQPGWQNNYDITVYQQGWRLGGKGASGRNAAMGERIEEHGLHIWFGFYANAFKMIKAAYASLNRPAGSPLATWSDAFKEQDYVAMSEFVRNEWSNWSIVFPTLPGEPGVGGETVGIWQIGIAVLGWIKEFLDQLAKAAHSAKPKSAHVGGVIPDWLHALAGKAEEEVEDLAADVSVAFAAVLGMAAALKPDSREHSPEHPPKGLAQFGGDGDRGLPNPPGHIERLTVPQRPQQSRTHI